MINELHNIGRPPASTYKFRYVIRPRIGPLAEAASFRCGWELNHPLRPTAVSYGDPDGRLPSARGMADFTDSSVVVTALKQAEDGDDIVLRVFEAIGKAVEVDVPDLPGVPSEVNFLEAETGPVKDNQIKFRPFEIKTIRFNE